MTQEFALYIDENTIRRPVKHYKSPNLIAFNFDKNIELMQSMGYKPLQYDEQTEPAQGYVLKPTYEDTEEAILVHWVEEEIQEENE